VVGTGGKNHYPLGSPPANVEASNDDTFGILQLTLRATSYDWQFIPVAGATFTDTGSTACH
jgi:acid phosphatase type 7